MRQAPHKWDPQGRIVGQHERVERAKVLHRERTGNELFVARGVPLEDQVPRGKRKDYAKASRYYPDLTDRLFGKGVPQPQLCVCGRRADEHQALPPHVRSNGSCDGFQQDPKWRPAPEPEPKERVFKKAKLTPLFDKNHVQHDNAAVMRARLHDALRPYASTRTRNCRQKRIGPVVQVQRDDQRMSVRGLETCANVWACPSCAAKILAHRAGELEQALDRWSGPEPLMLTLTVRHQRTDKLSFLRKRMLDAWNIFWNRGKGAQKRRAELDVRHHVRAVEVTFGDNGWHPHIHAFLFCGPELPREEVPVPAPAPLVLEAPTEAPKRRKRARSWLPPPKVPDKLLRELARAWRRAVVKAFTPREQQMPGRSAAERLEIGLRYRPTVARGLDLRPYTQSGAYLAKAGLEINLITKKGRLPGYMTSWEIAHKAAAGDPGAIGLWQHFQASMYGARQLTWSKGARRRFGLQGKETDDETLRRAEEAERGQVSQLVVQWTGRSWDRQRRRPGWWGRVMAACHSATPTLDVSNLPGAELRGPPGRVEPALGQPELARAGP